MDKNASKTLEIPYGVKEIDRLEDYFSYDSLMEATHIEIPNSVTKINANAFRNCSQLVCIMIPSSVTTIEEGAFCNCKGVSSIIISKHNPIFTSVNNCCLSNNLKVLEFGCKTSIIPDGITEIKPYAFCGCLDLTHIEIPDTVTKIGHKAFQNTGLKEILIPERVREIGEGAFAFCQELRTVNVRGQISKLESSMFSFCRKLAHVTLPSTLIEIGEGAFSYCSQYVVNIPDGVKKIGRGAFTNCFGSGLKGLVIPYSVREIGESAFMDTDIYKLEFSEDTQCFDEPSGIVTIEEAAFCRCKLTSVHIPSNVGKIGVRAFASNALTTISVAKSNPYFVAVNNCCLSNHSTTLVFGCGTSVIPEGVTKIGAYARAGTALTDVLIPDSVREIGYAAFAGGIFKSIELPVGLKKIQDKAFEDCYNLACLEIPENVTELGENILTDCIGLKRVSLNIPSHCEVLVSLFNNLQMIQHYMSIDTNKIEILFAVRSVEISRKVDELVKLGICLFGERRIILEVPIGTGYTYRNHPAFKGKIKEVIADLDV